MITAFVLAGGEVSIREMGGFVYIRLRLGDGLLTHGLAPEATADQLCFVLDDLAEKMLSWRSDQHRSNGSANAARTDCG